MISLVGQDRHAGILRFTFGQLYLWNGLSIIPVMVGLFAIPEIVDLAVRGTAIAGNVQLGKLGKGVREGVKDTFRHFWLTVRCSLIGSLIGTLPGVGGGWHNGCLMAMPRRVQKQMRSGLVWQRRCQRGLGAWRRQ